jgi:hypothetical protein
MTINSLDLFRSPFCKVVLGTAKHSRSNSETAEQIIITIYECTLLSDNQPSINAAFLLFMILFYLTSIMFVEYNFFLPCFLSFWLKNMFLPRNHNQQLFESSYNLNRLLDINDNWFWRTINRSWQKMKIVFDINILSFKSYKGFHFLNNTF